jgi:hypothetical protein
MEKARVPLFDAQQTHPHDEEQLSMGVPQGGAILSVWKPAVPDLDLVPLHIYLHIPSPMGSKQDQFCIGWMRVTNGEGAPVPTKGGHRVNMRKPDGDQRFYRFSTDF